MDKLRTCGGQWPVFFFDETFPDLIIVLQHAAFMTKQ